MMNGMLTILCSHRHPSNQLANLQDRVYGAQVKAEIKFKEDYANTIHNFNFKLGDLVLVWNTTIEKALNRKM